MRIASPRETAAGQNTPSQREVASVNWSSIVSSPANVESRSILPPSYANISTLTFAPAGRGRVGQILDPTTDPRPSLARIPIVSLGPARKRTDAAGKMRSVRAPAEPVLSQGMFFESEVRGGVRATGIWADSHSTVMCGLALPFTGAVPVFQPLALLHRFSTAHRKSQADPHQRERKRARSLRAEVITNSRKMTNRPQLFSL